jgi:hypothetical protein
VVFIIIIFDFYIILLFIISFVYKIVIINII